MAESEVRVSFDGLRQLESMTHEQYLNLSEASGFVCSGGLTNTGAFSGFLAVFRGTYEDALAAATDTLGEALQGARTMSTNLGDSLATYQRHDASVAQTMATLDVTLQCGPGYLPPEGGDDAGLPGVIGTAQDGHDSVRDVHDQVTTGAPEPSPDQPGIMAPLDMVNEYIDYAGAHEEFEDTVDDIEEKNQFVAEHR